MWAACTSPSIRASTDSTRVLGCSATATTLPRTMPSTRSPPLNITLPSMRVVTPIRLSMRFCGLLVLLNMLCSIPLEAHGTRGARLIRPGLVDARLDILHFRLRVHPEGALDAAEVLECQPECPCPGVANLGKGHHSTVAVLRQIDHELEAAIEL